MGTPDEIDYIIEALNKSHKRSDFSCGVPLLDQYFKQQAGQDQRKYIAAPFVAVDLAKQNIIGYYTLSATSVNVQDLPAELVKKLPKYPLVPAILLGRLAVAISYQKQGWGDLLLMDALARSFNNEIAAMGIIVDAKDEKARQFYQSYGFLQFPENPNKLILPMITIKTILAKNDLK